MNIIHLNARSLKSVTSNVNEIRNFNALIELSDSDIFGITETWLNSGTKQERQWHFNGIQKDIISRRRADLEPDCEIMVCDLQASNAKKQLLFFVTDLRLLKISFSVPP